MTPSLRARLVAVTLAVVFVGLSSTAVATYAAFRSFLLDGVDRQMDVVAGPLADELTQGGNQMGDHVPALADGTVVQLRASDGSVLAQLVAGPAPAIALPAELGIQGQDRERRFTLPGQDDAAGLRVLARATGTEGETVVVGVPLAGVERTLGRLVLIAAVAGAVALGLLGVLARAAITVGLRPLHAIEVTAAAIAAGDLSQRVTPSETRTEVGRLGAALNQMLGRIESAFAETTASEERLRRFVNDASHELRTPITSIRGYAELFRRGALGRPEDVATAVRRIEDETTRMGTLIDDLILLARLDQGPSLVREPVDLMVIAADAVTDARAVTPGRTIELAADAPVVVVGDNDRLRQVVLNLVSNARVHTPPTAAVRVSVRSRDGTAVLEVTDSGPGLDAGALDRVFERFYRTDASRSRSSGGSGLGLSIVSAITAAHGGQVSADSTPGAGCTFRVELPLASSDLPAEIPS